MFTPPASSTSGAGGQTRQGSNSLEAKLKRRCLYMCVRAVAYGPGLSCPVGTKDAWLNSFSRCVRRCVVV